MSTPLAVLRYLNADVDALEWMFRKETGIQTCTHGEALARQPRLGIFAETVTYNARNAYLVGSWLELFERLQHELRKPIVPAETAQREGEADEKWAPTPRHKWCRNYFYELIPESAACHLYFDIEARVPEGAARELLASKHRALFELCCAELQAQMPDDDGDALTCAMLVLDASNDRKFSRHLILHVDGTAFLNNSHCGAFVRYLVDKYPDELGDAGIDMDVYTRNRLFRTLYSSKMATPSRLFRPHSRITAHDQNMVRSGVEEVSSTLFHESLVTNVFSFHRAHPLARIKLIGYSDQFLAEHCARGRNLKRGHSTGDINTSAAQKKPQLLYGHGFALERLCITDLPFLMRCRDDIAAEYGYDATQDFAEFALYWAEPDMKTLLFPMASGACYFRGKADPHRRNHSYVVVNTKKLDFCAHCHSQKSPCVEQAKELQQQRVWPALSANTKRVRKRIICTNALLWDHVPAALRQ